MSNHLKQHIGYWLRRMSNEVHQSFEQRVAQYDVTIASWCILVSIYDGKASSIHELSKYIEVDKASISRVVERLVIKGLILHKQGKDRRSGIIELTHSGQQLVPKLILEAKKNELQFFSHLTEEEIKQLQQIMHKIIVNISTIKVDGWLLTNKLKDD
jgi:DNA-binding MarR family transcriptional regulator